jgi:type IV pilus assembly protein PilE
MKNISLKMLRRPRHAEGFTLIELMIAVAVVALLLAVALPAYNEQIAKGRRAEGKTALLKAIQLQERRYTAEGRYATDLGPLFGLGAGAVVRSGENPADVSGWYTLTADTTGCGVTDLAVCVRVVATPRVADANCGTLTLTSRGQQTESGTRDLAYCWRS